MKMICGSSMAAAIEDMDAMNDNATRRMDLDLGCIHVEKRYIVFGEDNRGCQ